MHCHTPPPDTTARLAAGQSLHVAVDAGTALLVTAGRLRVDEAPRWLADVCVPVGRSLGEGECHVIDRAGWVTLSALGGPVQWHEWPAPAAAPRRPWLAWRWRRASAS